MFLRPAGIGGQILGRGTGMVFWLLERLTGVDLLHDLSVFFRALGGMIDGFTERARRVGALLEDPATTFLIVTSPRHDPVEEAIFFHRKLRDADMPFGGLVVNRLHAAPVGGGALPATSSAPTSRGAGRIARTSWRRSPSATRPTSSTCGRGSATRRRSSCPELDDDVHDVEGLALVREHLFADG